MKPKILLLALLFTKAFSSFGQVTLEATYDSASLNFYMVNLEVDGYKYVKIQRSDSTHRFIRLYNLDHSLWKTIDCRSFPVKSTGLSLVYNNDFLYISQHLFDNDDDVEFMYVVAIGSHCGGMFTGIYNEDGSAIFTQDSAAPLVRANTPQTFKPIYNTPNGTKMILSFPCTKEAKVYSLSGTGTTDILSLKGTDNNDLNAFPNPSNELTTIEFTLPKSADEGEIILYDINEREVKRYSVDNTFNTLLIHNSDLNSGTYFYSLIANNKIFDTKKIVINR